MKKLMTFLFILLALATVVYAIRAYETFIQGAPNQELQKYSEYQASEKQL